MVKVISEQQRLVIEKKKEKEKKMEKKKERTSSLEKIKKQNNNKNKKNATKTNNNKTARKTKKDKITKNKTNNNKKTTIKTTKNKKNHTITNKHLNNKSIKIVKHITKKSLITIEMQNSTTKKTESIPSWEAWYKYPELMKKYKTNNKLKGRYWDKDKDDDYEIKMIVGFTKKLKNKRLCTYKVVWDTGHMEENIKRHCLLSDTKNLYDNFWKNQK